MCENIGNVPGILIQSIKDLSFSSGTWSNFQTLFDGDKITISGVLIVSNHQPIYKHDWIGVRVLFSCY